MPFTIDQIDQLVTAFPFASRDDWEFVAYSIEVGTTLTPDTFFADVLVAAREALKQAQYILEEPDDLLLNMSSRISGQVRPAANTVTTIESATTARVLVYGLLITNTGATVDSVRVHHVKAGGSATDSNLIRLRDVPGTPNGEASIDLRLPLLPGEFLAVRSTTGTSTFTSYVD